MTPKVLVLDLYNLLHRARGGFQLGPAPVTFNFFRSLRALVQQFEPTRIVAVDEGEPLAKLKLMPDYKGNRVIPTWDTAKQDEMRRFREQKTVCIDLLKRRFPISVVRHPNYEADDLLATLVHRGSSAVPHVIVSTDSDFIQLLGPEYIKLYNPVKKNFIKP